MKLTTQLEFIPSLIFSSYAAGFLISLGSAAYCATGATPIGALLFSIGLILICRYGFDLYTGKIGYISASNFAALPIILLFNIVGALMGGQFAHVASNTTTTATALNIITTKNTCYPFESLARAVLCGMCVFGGVDYYKRNNSMLGIIFLIPLFIICGWDHCIANIAYAAIAGQFINIPRFLLVVLGNSLGAILFRALIELKEI